MALDDAGPEMARIINEISVKHSPKSNCSQYKQIPSIQSRFATNMRGMVNVFNEMGNPFKETSSGFLVIDTKIIMADEVIRSIKEAGDLEKFSTKLSLMNTYDQDDKANP